MFSKRRHLLTALNSSIQGNAGYMSVEQQHQPSKNPVWASHQHHNTIEIKGASQTLSM